MTRIAKKVRAEKPRAVKSAPRAPAPKAVAEPVEEVAELMAQEPVAVVVAAPPPKSLEAKRAGIKLEPTCLLRDAGEMQFQLLAADFGGCDVLIDGSVVDRIDTAGLQLLIGFVRYQEGRGKKVGWTAASPELLRCGRQLGVLDSIRLTGAVAEGIST